MKKRTIVFIIYLVFACAVLMTSSTLAKYFTSVDKSPTFVIGSNLFFDYSRGDLFRNNQLIVGVETEYEDNGVTYQRIETMNVAPGDNLTYHFYVSNFDEVTGEANGIMGEFFPQAGATLALPILGDTENIQCTISYREIPLDGSDPSATFILVTDDFVLPKVESDNDKVKYEFKVEVILDGQISHTSSEDYFGASLTIYLFVDAASALG